MLLKFKMKSLMFHCKNYEINLTGISNRPRNIKPEKVKEKNQVCKDCIVALITVEKQDNINKCLPELKKEILKFSKEVKSDKIVILPLSSSFK